MDLGEFRKAAKFLGGEPPHQPTYRPPWAAISKPHKAISLPSSTDTTWPPSSAALPQPDRRGRVQPAGQPLCCVRRRDVGKVLSTTARSPRHVYNWHDDTETVYNGMAARRSASRPSPRGLDASCPRRSLFRVEVSGNPKQVFLIRAARAGPCTARTPSSSTTPARSSARPSASSTRGRPRARRRSARSRRRPGPGVGDLRRVRRPDVDKILLDYTEKRSSRSITR